MLTTPAWTPRSARLALPSLALPVILAACASDDAPPPVVGALPGVTGALVVEARLEGEAADDTLLRLTAEGYREEVRTGSDGQARVSGVPAGPLQLEAVGPNGTAVWIGLEGRAATVSLPTGPTSIATTTVTLAVPALEGLAGDLAHEARGGFTVHGGEVDATAAEREAAGEARCMLGPDGCALRVEVPVGTRRVIATVVELDGPQERVVAYAASSARELARPGLDLAASPLTPIRETPVTLAETGVAGVIGVPGVAPDDGSVFFVPFSVVEDGVVALPELEGASYWLTAVAAEGRVRSVGRNDGTGALSPPAFAAPAEPRLTDDGVAFGVRPGEMVFAVVTDEAGGRWEVLWLDPARPWSPPEDSVGALSFAVETVLARNVSPSQFELDLLRERFDTLTRSGVVLDP